MITLLRITVLALLLSPALAHTEDLRVHATKDLFAEGASLRLAGISATGPESFWIAGTFAMEAPLKSAATVDGLWWATFDASLAGIKTNLGTLGANAQVTVVLGADHPTFFVKEGADCRLLRADRDVDLIQSGVKTRLCAGDSEIRGALNRSGSVVVWGSCAGQPCIDEVPLTKDAPHPFLRFDELGTVDQVALDADRTLALIEPSSSGTKPEGRVYEVRRGADGSLVASKLASIQGRSIRIVPDLEGQVFYLADLGEGMKQELRSGSIVKGGQVQGGSLVASGRSRMQHFGVTRAPTGFFSTWAGDSPFTVAILSSSGALSAKYVETEQIETNDINVVCTDRYCVAAVTLYRLSGPKTLANGVRVDLFNSNAR